jgi:hypothetical protein
LPLAWCAWLLVWLVPSMLLAPHLATPRAWLTSDTAPAAVVAAAAFFLVCVWPFWPALAGAPEAGRRARWLGRSLLELVMLLALAAPFVLVAWSLGGRPVEAGRLAVLAAGLGGCGLLLRITAAGLSAGGARWFLGAVLLISAGPMLAAYAGAETTGIDLGPRLSASPVAQAVHVAIDGRADWSWINSVAAIVLVTGVTHLASLLARRRQVAPRL